MSRQAMTLRDQEAMVAADTEARWQQMRAMMRCPRWQRAILAKRFFEAFADEVAG